MVVWTMVSFKPWPISRESIVHQSFLQWRCRYWSCAHGHWGHSMNSRRWLCKMQSHFSSSELWDWNVITITLNFCQTCKLKCKVQFCSCLSPLISRNHIKEITNYARKKAYKLVAVNYNSFPLNGKHNPQWILKCSKSPSIIFL